MVQLRRVRLKRALQLPRGLNPAGLARPSVTVEDLNRVELEDDKRPRDSPTDLSALTKNVPATAFVGTEAALQVAVRLRNELIAAFVAGADRPRLPWKMRDAGGVFLGFNPVLIAFEAAELSPQTRQQGIALGAISGWSAGKFPLPDPIPDALGVCASLRCSPALVEILLTAGDTEPRIGTATFLRLRKRLITPQATEIPLPRLASDQPLMLPFVAAFPAD